MADEIIKFSIPADKDGFVSFNCPYCGHRFKLSAAEAEAEDVISLWCPACGLQNRPSAFISKEAVEAAQILAENYVREMLNDFGRQLERQFRGSKFMKVQKGKPIPLEADKILIEEDDLQVIRLSCCDKSMRTRTLELATGYYCPYCGGRR